MFGSGYSHLYSDWLYDACDKVAFNIATPEGDMRHEFISKSISVEKLFKPNKRTLLHDYITDTLNFYSEYWTRKTEDFEDWIQYLQSMSVEYPSRLLEEDGWERPVDRLIAFDELLFEANGKLTHSVFHIFFNDREICRRFNSVVAERVTAKLSSETFCTDGAASAKVYRPTYIPVWLKRAIWHRDRGRCQICWKDLSGEMEPITNAHLDHIIPLAEFGCNDPSNFQLVCADCNLRKGSKLISTEPRVPLPWLS